MRASGTVCAISTTSPGRGVDQHEKGPVGGSGHCSMRCRSRRPRHAGSSRGRVGSVERSGARANRPGAAARPPAPKPATSHPVAAPTGMTAAEQTALIRQYCATCHSERAKAGGLSLAGFDAAKRASEHRASSEKMIRKLRAGMMPPAGAKRPDAAAHRRRSPTALETRMDDAAALNPNPGRRPFQRLNRAEYAARRARPARPRRRRRRLPAARHHQRRLRQRRRRAERSRRR